MGYRRTNKNYLEIVFILTISLAFFSCKKQDSICYKIDKINIPKEGTVSSVVFIYYQIFPDSLAFKFKGEHLVDDVYKKNINFVTVLKDGKKIDVNESIKIKVNSNNKVNLVYGTSRFETVDNIEILNKLKSETLLIEMKDGSQYTLNYCN